MFKPEEKIAMFKVILSAEQHGNDRMKTIDVLAQNLKEFIKHYTAAELCRQLLDILNNEELLKERYVIAQGVHQHIGKADSLIERLTNIVNHPDILEDEEEGEEDV